MLELQKIVNLLQLANMAKRAASSQTQTTLAASLKQNQRETERLGQQLFSAQVMFISTEIDLALTFCAIAESSKEGERKRRNIANAMKARGVAAHFIGSRALPDDLEKELGAKLAKLELALASANSKNGDPK